MLAYRDLDDACALVARGGGSLVASVYGEDRDFLLRMVTELGAGHGRILAVDPAIATAHTGHGIVMPQCNHGGPGRAGAGEELGGAYGLRFYHQRLAVQGSSDLLASVQAQGGEPALSRKQVSSSRERTAHSFVERHGLWTEEQFQAAAEAEKSIEERGLEVVRLSFPDQHGILRGKTMMASEAARSMRDGCTITTTLLAKDTAHKTVFPVFTPGGGFGMPEMEGAGDFLMIADPTTFRVLPWAPRTGWALCDMFFGNGNPVPFSTRNLYRRALAKLAEAGFDYLAGLEVEFHIFKLDDARLRPADATWPGEAPEVSLISQGYQYLTETRFDQIEPILEIIRRELTALGLPLRSVEVELGPSQCEFTLQPQRGLAPADTMMLFRSAVKQICRRHGYHASFMCRPKVANVMSSGWHLHQSLIDRRTLRQRLCIGR